ncbi:MAG TPA: AIR synthase-related protein, partial [bacterium]|nr:AIR synthase-related protein [bacterium]
LGLASSGVHSNGYSLVRKIVADRKLDLNKVYPGFAKPLGQVLLEPTFVYVNPILQLRKEFPILGIAHITGGGLLENIPRILPVQSRVALKRSAWPRVPVFDFLQEQGRVEDAEMHRVFNCGIGMVLVVKPGDAEEILNRLNAGGQPAYLIGEIAARGAAEAPQVLIQD